MHIPNVEFTEIPLPLETELFYGFLFEEGPGWASVILERHPGIEGVCSLPTEEERMAYLNEYLVGAREKNVEQIRQNQESYRTEWEKVGPELFLVLSDIIGIRWPAERETIRAMASLNPICPRFLDDWSFSLYFDFTTPFAMSVIMHESCHFLYFEKWKQLFPDMDPEKFESPHIEWHLSEILAPVILNDPRIQALLGQEATFYGIHENVRIGSVSAPEFFSNLYREKGTDFEAFLKEAYEEIQKGREEFIQL